jgi:heme/copper-type cytochrome/quinol oxidase subunit 3
VFQFFVLLIFTIIIFAFHIQSASDYKIKKKVSRKPYYIAAISTFFLTTITFTMIYALIFLRSNNVNDYFYAIAIGQILSIFFTYILYGFIDRIRFSKPDNED